MNQFCVHSLARKSIQYCLASQRNWIGSKRRDREAQRFNLAQRLAAFAANAFVNAALSAESVECLPLILVSGSVVTRRDCPCRQKFAELVFPVVGNSTGAIPGRFPRTDTKRGRTLAGVGSGPFLDTNACRDVRRPVRQCVIADPNSNQLSHTMKFLDNPTRNLFFTGKGGVGKTSVACSAAVRLADTGEAGPVGVDRSSVEP